MDIIINTTATASYALIGVGAIGFLGLMTVGGMIMAAWFSPEYQRYRRSERRANLWHKQRMNRYARARERAQW